LKDYRIPFRFTRTQHKHTLKIEPPVLTEADKRKLMQAHRNNAASQWGKQRPCKKSY
jgi:hypothetical protein